MASEERVVLCASNAYNKKYYLNENFDSLPQGIKEELQILSVTFTEDIGGVLSIGFEDDGKIFFEVQSDLHDLLYDEIGSHLKAKELQRKHRELWEGIEVYYKVFFLGENE